MEKVVFIPFSALSHWVGQGWVDVDASNMILSLRGHHFQLRDAFLVVSVEGGGQDKIGLVGRVVTPQELEALRAGRFGSYMLLGEVAYRLTPGFLAEPIICLDLDGILDVRRQSKAFPAPSAKGRSRQFWRADATEPYYPLRKAHEKKAPMNTPLSEPLKSA
jgi:hypothetical protein